MAFIREFNLTEAFFLRNAQSPGSSRKTGEAFTPIVTKCVRIAWVLMRKIQNQHLGSSRKTGEALRPVTKCVSIAWGSDEQNPKSTSGIVPQDGGGVAPCDQMCMNCMSSDEQNPKSTSGVVPQDGGGVACPVPELHGILITQNPRLTSLFLPITKRYYHQRVPRVRVAAYYWLPVSCKGLVFLND